MNNHHLGRLPATRDRHGARILGDEVLVREAASVLRSVVTRHPRWARMGFHVDVEWLKSHLDDDEVLAQRVLTGAGFAPDSDGRWTWRSGGRSLSKVTDLHALGDALVNLVNIHRPV